MNYKFIIKREIFSKTMANKSKKKKIDNKNNEEKQITVIYFEWYFFN